MPARFVKVDRGTPLLLPPDRREGVPADHLAHFVIDAVEQLAVSPLRSTNAAAAANNPRLA